MFISTYQLLNMFRATMCPSSGADDLVIFSLPCGVVPYQWAVLFPYMYSISGLICCLFLLGGLCGLVGYCWWFLLQPNHTTHLIKTDNISTRKYYTYVEITLSIVTALHQTGEKIPLSRQLLKMGTWWHETC